MASKNLSTDKFEDALGSADDEDIEEWPIDPDGVDAFDSED